MVSNDFNLLFLSKKFCNITQLYDLSQIVSIKLSPVYVPITYTIVARVLWNCFINIEIGKQYRKY